MSEWFRIAVCSPQGGLLFVYEDRRIPRVGEILGISIDGVPHTYAVEGMRTDIVLAIVDRYDEKYRSADSLINRAAEYTVTATEIKL
jgi:hypothetical protein